MSIYSEPENWINESVKSILNQSFTDFEFILINDNPTQDRNIKILKRYQRLDSRIKIIHNDINNGLTKSLNKGLSIAQGEYIARMDADDISLSHRFQTQLNFLEQNHSIGIIGSYIQTFGRSNKNLTFPYKHNDIFARLILTPPLVHSTYMLRKSLIDSYKIKYDEQYRYAQDYEILTRFAQITKFANVPDILLKYRVNKHQISSTPSFNIIQKENAIKIRKKFISWILNDLNIDILLEKNKSYYQRSKLINEEIWKNNNLNKLKTNDIEKNIHWFCTNYTDDKSMYIINILKNHGITKADIKLAIRNIIK